MSGALLVASIFIVMPAHAQLPFTLKDCLADRDEDARLHICSIMSGTEEEKALGAVEASRVLRARGEYDAALALVTGLWPGVSRDAELGHIWFEQGDHRMADFHFEMALEYGLDPDRQTRERMVIAAHMHGEELQYSSENFPGAISAYSRALALNPDHAPALLGLAEALQRLDRHEEALADLDRAIALGADWTGYLLRARSRRALGDMPGAIADFRQVLEENPEHLGARQALAEMTARP